MLVRTKHVRKRGGGGRSGEGRVVELLGELFGVFKGRDMTEAASLMTFRYGTKWGVWRRG